MSVETHLGVRGLCTGIVKDVRNWSTLPVVGPHRKLMYVLRGRRSVFVVGLVVVVVLAYIVLVHLRGTPVCVVRAPSAPSVSKASMPVVRSAMDSTHDMRSLIPPPPPPRVSSDMDMGGLAGDMFKLYNE